MNLFLAPKSKQVLLYLGAIALCLTFIACDDDDPVTPDPPEPDPDPDEETVADVLEDSDDVSDFYDALVDADLVGELADADEVTVFAPDNDAFGEADLEEADTQAVLEYHIVDGSFTEADLNDGDSLETWQGSQIAVTVDDEGNVLLDDAQIADGNIGEPENGVVNVIDQVLMPEEDNGDVPQEGTVADTIAAREDLSAFDQAITTDEEFETELRTATEVTVFAPDDDAFDEAEIDIDEMSEEDLRNTLDFHVVDGTFTAADLEEETSLETWQGGELEVSTDEDGNVTVDGATVTEEDLEADNGVVHVIDDVLSPPEDDNGNGEPGDENTVLDLIEDEEDLSEFHQALLDNDIEDELADFDELTVFAPDNDAFDEVDLGEFEDDEVRDLLLNHFVEGAFMAEDLEDGETLDTVADGELEVTTEDDEVFVGDATVIETDLEADNGVVHKIDTVLPPPEDGNGDGNGDNG